MVTQEELEKMSPEEIAALQRQNCIFCKIVAGEIPSAKVLENQNTLSILDINPARPGHALVMPREHYAILPLVPPDIFKKMFIDAKLIAMAIKKKTLAGSSSIFIANGALAGQQSPHFLFHIIPDQKFFLTKNDGLLQPNNDLADALKNNLGIMMANHFKREGIAPPQALKDEQPLDLEKKREQIAKIIQENQDVRDLLKSDVEKFKETIQHHDQLKQLFEGVDLNSLSEHLQSFEEQPQDSNYSPKEEIFFGEKPQEQKTNIIGYFKQKPKAKELLISDVDTFKEILSKREDIQPLFKDVNIDALSKKLAGGDL